MDAHWRPYDSTTRGVKSYPPGSHKAYLATLFAARVSSADPAVEAAVATYVSAQQCVTETSESRWRSWRTQRTSALSPTECPHPRMRACTESSDIYTIHVVTLEPCIHTTVQYMWRHQQTMVHQCPRTSKHRVRLNMATAQARVCTSRWQSLSQTESVGARFCNPGSSYHTHQVVMAAKRASPMTDTETSVGY